MKRLLLSTAAIALLGGSAIAADLPIYEPAPVIAPVPEVFSWTGFYAGAAVGYGWGDFEANDFDGCRRVRGDRGRDCGPDDEFDGDGFLGHVFAGYRHQFDSPLVLGVEGSLGFSGVDSDGDDDDDDDNNNNNNNNRDDNDRYNADMGFHGSLVGQAGFAAGRALIYGLGGVAFADLDGNVDGRRGRDTDNDGVDDVFFGDDDDDDNGDIKSGPTVGLGVDFAVTDNVFIRGEGRYTDYDFDDEGDERGQPQDLEIFTIHVGAGFTF